MGFSIWIGPEVYQDIQQGIDWYNQQKENLGYKFYKEVETVLKLVQNSPYFQVRYGHVRCVPLKRFPYMIHFTVDELNQTISIQAILHTSRNNKSWKDRK